MKKILVASLAIAMTLSVSSAYATLYTFDFTNDGSGSLVGAKGFTSEAGGLLLTALAQTESSGTVNTAPLSWGSPGLWIENSTNDSSHEIDGYGLNERVLFQFAQPTTIKSVSFNYVDSDGSDDFTFWVGQAWSAANLKISSTDIPGTPNTYTFAQTWTDTYFGIGALGDDDDFKIRSIKVDVVDPVPEPATMLLFGAGIASLAAVGRRKRS